MVPKLVAEDIPLLFSLLNDVFPGNDYQRNHMKDLKAEIAKICAEEQLNCGDEEAAWIDKVNQPYQITTIRAKLSPLGLEALRKRKAVGGPIWGASKGCKGTW